MKAPIGTAARPASSSAIPQGSPNPAVRCPIVVAPIAANAAWHSDTCPDVRTSRPSDRNRTTWVSPSDQ